MQYQVGLLEQMAARVMTGHLMIWRGRGGPRDLLQRRRRRAGGTRTSVEGRERGPVAAVLRTLTDGNICVTIGVVLEIRTYIDPTGRSPWFAKLDAIAAAKVTVACPGSSKATYQTRNRSAKASWNIASTLVPDTACTSVAMATSDCLAGGWNEEATAAGY